MFESIYPTKGKYFQKFAILFISVFVSLRNNFGADYLTYSDSFYRFQSGIFIDLFEPGYILLNIIIGSLGLDFHFLLLVIALFNYTLLYLSIENYAKKNKWISIFLFLILFDLFFYSLSAIRQSIAMSIFLYASKYIVSKSPKKYFLWILTGMLFHWSSIVLLPIYYIYNHLRNRSYIYLSITLSISLVIYFIFTKFIDQLAPVMNDKLLFYLVLEKSTDQIGTNYVNAVIYIIAAYLIIYLSSLMNKKYKISKEKILFPMFAFLIFAVLKVMQSIEYYSILPRIQMYFYIFYIFALPQILSIFVKKSKDLLLITLFFLLIYFFIVKYLDIISYASIYYTNFNLIIFNQ